MYGNRSMGGYSNQQGLMGSTSMMMGNQMAGMANMQLLGQVGGQRGLRGSGSLFPMNASPGMQPGGFNINSRMNMTPQAQDAVLDILVINMLITHDGNVNIEHKKSVENDRNHCAGT